MLEAWASPRTKIQRSLPASFAGAGVWGRSSALPVPPVPAAGALGLGGALRLGWRLGACAAGAARGAGAVGPPRSSRGRHRRLFRREGAVARLQIRHELVELLLGYLLGLRRGEPALTRAAARLGSDFDRRAAR